MIVLARPPNRLEHHIGPCQQLGSQSPAGSEHDQMRLAALFELAAEVGELDTIRSRPRRSHDQAWFNPGVALDRDDRAVEIALQTDDAQGVLTSDVIFGTEATLPVLDDALRQQPQR